MATAPYERLYNDIEEGFVSSSSSDQLPSHDHSPFRKRILSLSPFSSSSPSLILAATSTLLRLSPWRRRGVIVLCLLLSSTALVALWSVTLDSTLRTYDYASSSNSSSSIHWPPSKEANGDYSVRYTYIPFEPSSPVPQSPPAPIPFEALDALFDPSSLLKKTASGLRLSSNVNAFFTKPTKFDVVWTWVNGSDPLHRQALAEAEKEHFVRRKRDVQRQSDLGASSLQPTTSELDVLIKARASSSPKLYRYALVQRCLPALPATVHKLTCPNLLLSSNDSYIGIMTSLDIH